MIRATRELRRGRGTVVLNQLPFRLPVYLPCLLRQPHSLFRDFLEAARRWASVHSFGDRYARLGI